MTCQKCKSERIAKASAKCSDLFYFEYGNKSFTGYPSHDVGLGGGDYVAFSYCLDCGTIQGTWPVSEETVLEVFPLPRCSVCGAEDETSTPCAWCANLVCSACAIKVQRKGEDCIYCKEECKRHDDSNFRC